MRRCRPAPRQASQRWMVSYADMVTLLFACFAALYASSTIPQTAAAAEQPIEAPDTSERDRIVDEIETAVGRADGANTVAVRADAHYIVISLPEAGTFAPGQADLSQAARRVIRELAPVLESQVGDIRVEGHTDDVPITTSRFVSNWDLSAARATEVVRFLVSQTNILPSRLSAAGYGEFRPTAANDSPDNRARNRRVDIVVVNR